MTVFGVFLLFSGVGWDVWWVEGVFKGFAVSSIFSKSRRIIYIET